MTSDTAGTSTAGRRPRLRCSSTPLSRTDPKRQIFCSLVRYPLQRFLLPLRCVAVSSRGRPQVTQSALVVCTDVRRLSVYTRALGAVADVVYGARTFAQAQALLVEKHPDVLVAEVRLHAYNGIHLALWSLDRLPRMRSVIVGDSSPALEKEAHAAGAVYLHCGDNRTVMEAAQDALARRSRPRRWRRNRLEQRVPARVGDRPAHLVDVSYGGFRIETAAPVVEDRAAGFTIDIPEFGVRARAKCMWTRQVGASSRYWCGAALGIESRTSQWRDLVDALVARCNGSRTTPA